MAMQHRDGQAQGEFWVATQDLIKAPSRPFYDELNRILARAGFDPYVEGLCADFYKEGGRPSVPPGVYFRMLFLGYFEGLESERGIAWACADSLSLRTFLGYGVTEATPDHSSLSRIRQRLDLETHHEVFVWILTLLAKEDLLRGKTTGVDATTLEANAALRTLVCRDTGEKYRDFLVRLAKESGIETPTREDLARLDRKRPHKGSNDDWKNPHDPDAKIAKMKNGSTDMAHKAEHAVDMESGAVVAVTLQGANLGDTGTICATVTQATENLERVADDAAAARKIAAPYVQEVVADKGYHSNQTLVVHTDAEIRTYIAEPGRRGERHWEDKRREQKEVYGNRRRIKGARGRRLLRKRGELIERSFAHCYESGGLRRIFLKGHAKILKRLLIHVAAFNVSLILRKLIGCGTPREAADRAKSLILAFFGPVARLGEPYTRTIAVQRPTWFARLFRPRRPRAA